MALFRIYPEKDAFIWSEPTVGGLYGNAGKDEVLEIGGYPDADLTGRTNRAMIQFRQADITSSINEKVTGGFSASLNLSLAHTKELIFEETLIRFKKAIDKVGTHIQLKDPKKALKGNLVEPTFSVRK